MMWDIWHPSVRCILYRLTKENYVINSNILAVFEDVCPFLSYAWAIKIRKQFVLKVCTQQMLLFGSVFTTFQNRIVSIIVHCFGNFTFIYCSDDYGRCCVSDSNHLPHNNLLWSGLSKTVCIFSPYIYVSWKCFNKNVVKYLKFFDCWF